MKRDEILVAFIIFIFGGITSLLSLGMPIGTFRAPGTGMFPLFLGIALMFLSLLFISKSLYESKKLSLWKSSKTEIHKFPITLLLFLGAMVLFTIFFNKLGYLLYSFLLMLVLLKILGLRSLVITIILSFSTAIFSYFIFIKLLEIPLPKGWIGI